MEMQLHAFQTSVVGGVERYISYCGHTTLETEISSEKEPGAISRAAWIWWRRRPLRGKVEFIANLSNPFLKLSFDIFLPSTCLCFQMATFQQFSERTFYCTSTVFRATHCVFLNPPGASTSISKGIAVICFCLFLLKYE
jgi:hypothetical protein